MTKNARHALLFPQSRERKASLVTTMGNGTLARVWLDFLYSAEIAAAKGCLSRSLAGGNKCGRRGGQKEEMGFERECAAAVSRRDFSTTISHDVSPFRLGSSLFDNYTTASIAMARLSRKRQLARSTVEPALDPIPTFAVQICAYEKNRRRADDDPARVS